MNYDTIIVEMFSKIEIMEKRIARMEKRLIQEGVFDEDDTFQNNIDITITNPQKSNKITTAAIKRYIDDLIENERKKGNQSITLVARDIHNALNLKRSYPMVCNAMRQCMQPIDKVIHSTESGYSSTLEIKYYT